MIPSRSLAKIFLEIVMHLLVLGVLLLLWTAQASGHKDEPAPNPASAAAQAMIALLHLR